MNLTVSWSQKLATLDIHGEREVVHSRAYRLMSTSKIYAYQANREAKGLMTNSLLTIQEKQLFIDFREGKIHSLDWLQGHKQQAQSNVLLIQLSASTALNLHTRGNK